MKRLPKSKKGIGYPIPFKIDLKMRLAILCFLLPFLGMQAKSSFAQKTITLNVKEASVFSLLEKIESHTDYRFVYKVDDVHLARVLNLNVKNEGIPKVLDEIFRNADIEYRVIDNYVFLNKRKGFSFMATPVLFKKKLQQQIEITGTVTDENGVPLPGANVVEEGTTNGVTTDFDGKFSIRVSDENTLLEVSYIGFEETKFSLEGKMEVTIVLKQSTSSLDQVVVTALGIKRQEKSLTYSTQNVDVESLDEARPQQNLVNTLQGKVAGLSMVRSGTGVSGESRVNLRGNRSIDGSSQPLYVIDGVPVGQDISDISPDDVASISVLKGGNAAALYGSRANNGAIIITTKTGGVNQLSLDFNVGLTFEKAKVLYDYQNEYGQGVEGSYYDSEGNPLSGSLESWGQKLDGSLVRHWSPDPNKQGETIPYSANPNRFDDFLQTGYTNTYSLSARSGTETSQLYFGYTFDNRKGVMPGNEMTRHNATLRLNQKYFNNHLVLDTKINYIRSDIDNELATGGNFENPWRHFYRIPTNIRDQDLREFEYVTEEGETLQNFWLPGSNGGSNPYWVANRNVNNQTIDRILSHVSVEYRFSDKLSLMARSAFETSSRYYELKFYNDTYIIGQNGEYRTDNSHFYDWNSDFLLSYNDKISDKFKFNINVGGNNRRVRARSVNTVNNGLTIPNIFSLSNALQPEFSQSIDRKNVQSLYSFGQLTYDNAVYLDLTYRNDWSSTLPKTNWSFGYYSVGLSAVVSDLLEFGDGFNYLKLRGSYAQVGNDPGAFQLDRTAELRPGGLIYLSQTLPNVDLKAEKTVSKEAGFDARFFNNRLGVDFTYYLTNSTNQLFTQDIPLGSGVRHRFLNGANVENKGIEVILTTRPIDNDFRWDINLNFSKNDSKVKELAQGIDRLAFGSSAYGIRNFQLVVGSKWGDQFSRGFLRDDQNRIIVDSRGLPKTTSGKTVAVANFNPDWLAGISNSFSYKNIDFSFLIDYRKGGTVLSETLASLASGGFLESTLIGRDGSLVVGQNIFDSDGAVKEDGTPNDIEVTAEDLWKSLGKGEQPVGEAFVEDATNVRLRQFTLGYNLPQSILDKTPFTNVKFSLVGNNLFFFYNAASFDPEVSVGTGLSDEGFDSYGQPFTRSFGLNIKFGF